jgi:hypothetical protein
MTEKELLRAENDCLRDALEKAIDYLAPRIVGGKVGVELMPTLKRALAFRAYDEDTMENGLTRAETEATPSCAGLTVKPWTDWPGGACPVRWTETVEIRFRDGDTDIDFAQAYDWGWSKVSTVADIVAYRVL